MTKRVQQVNLETLLQAYPDISAKRERTGIIEVFQNMHDGTELVMRVHPSFANDEQINPSVAIQVRRTREFSAEGPVIEVTPITEDSVNIALNETNGKLDENIDPQNVIRNARIGLNLLQAYVLLPPGDNRRMQHVQRVYDEMQPQDYIADVITVTPMVATMFNKFLTSYRKFLPYATKILGKIPEPPATK